MTRAFSALIACSALLLATGCGSSSSSSSGTSSSSTSTASSLKATTTPKYASPSGAPVQSGTVQIAYRNIAIAPDTVKVKLGSTIKWTNYDSVEHNVTSKGGGVSFASSNFGEGKTFEFKALKLGVLNYLCTIHPASMNGSIEVVQ